MVKQMGQETTEKQKKTPVGKKIFAVLGILFVSIGIFLAAFGFSFKILMLPKETSESLETEIDRLKTENVQLEKEIKILKEQNDILMGRGTSGSLDDDIE